MGQDEEFTLENSNLPDKMLSLNSEDDRKLAQSAQMYHYQHQKQQMLALEKLVKNVNILIKIYLVKLIYVDLLPIASCLRD